MVLSIKKNNKKHNFIFLYLNIKQFMVENIVNRIFAITASKEDIFEPPYIFSDVVKLD